MVLELHPGEYVVASFKKPQSIHFGWGFFVPMALRIHFFAPILSIGSGESRSSAVSLRLWDSFRLCLAYP